MKLDIAEMRTHGCAHCKQPFAKDDRWTILAAQPDYNVPLEMGTRPILLITRMVHEVCADEAQAPFAKSVGKQFRDQYRRLYGKPSPGKQARA